MRPPLRGGGRGGGGGFRGGGGGRFGGGGGRFGGGGGRFGGRGGGGGGWQDQGPPESVAEMGQFLHACEGEAVVKLTHEKVQPTCVCMQYASLPYGTTGFVWPG